jgi:hypothetical protein
MAGVGGLPQHGVPERRQPSLAASAEDAGDLLIGAIEQGDQLLAGERPLARVGLGIGIGDVYGGVPLVHHLDWMRAEPLLALGRPLIGRIDEIGAERVHGLLVVAQCRALQIADRPQITQPLVYLPG